MAGMLPPVPDDLVQWMTAEGRFNEALVKNNLYNGKYYGVPYLVGRHAIYYNTDMFAAAGLPAEGPKTMDDLRNYAKKLAKYRRGRQPDGQRHQPAPVGRGQRHRREVLDVPLPDGRLPRRADQVGQVAQQLQQRGGPQDAAVVPGHRLQGQDQQPADHGRHRRVQPGDGRPVRSGVERHRHASPRMRRT